MARTRTHNWMPFLKAVLLVFTFAVGILSSDDARAQVVNTTCTALDTNLGGTPLTNTIDQVFITVAQGDRIIVDSIGGSTDFTPPGGPFTTLPTPIVFTIDSTQTGVWIFESGIDISCRVGFTPTVKRDTTDGLVTTLLRAGRSILDPIDIPDAMPRSYKPAAGRPLKYAPPVSTADPYYERFGLTDAPRDIETLSADKASDSFNFTVDLRSLMAKSRSKDGAAFGQSDGNSGYHGRWNTWMSGRYTEFDDDDQNASRDGHLWSVTSGLSYQIGAQTRIGVFSRVREGAVGSDEISAKLDSEFFGGGAFIATRLGGGLGVTGALLYEGGDNDISIQGATGSFDSDQWTVEGRIDKRIMRGRHWIEPAINVLYTSVDRDGYTDSTGAVVTGSSVELGRLTYGPKIGTTLHARQSRIMPFLHLNGVWDFANEGDYQLIAGSTFSSADAAFNAGGGVEVAFHNGALVSLGSDWYGFDDDFESWSVKGTASMPLAALGFGAMGPASLVSLDLAGNDTGGSAKARLRLPLN